MSARPDIERSQAPVNPYYGDREMETEALLPTTTQNTSDAIDSPTKNKEFCWQQPLNQPKFGVLHITGTFVLGALATLLMQYAACGTKCMGPNGVPTPAQLPRPVVGEANAFVPPYVGSTTMHRFPPPNPTNAFPSYFPTNVGYAGATPTGGEAAVMVTAPSYPMHTGECAHQLLRPAKLEASVGSGSEHEEDDGTSNRYKKKKESFNIFRSWGNLSPWYSVPRDAFGLDSSPGVPGTCRVTGLHFLHRHGARYPTAYASYGGPAKFATKLHKDTASWNTTGQVSFLNDWTYKLGEELLTPFGRQQLFDLGLSVRMRYGFLLQNFTDANVIPVFRTESQDRMLASAMNFAIGFFGYPFERQYQQLITIEAKGFNNTLAPYDTCSNANVKSKGERGGWYVSRWAERYLEKARKRLQKHFHGLELTIEDVYEMQQLCPYETVALGYSKFCELFTQEEWEGFDYSLDLYFWYNSAFGAPTARAQGIGYIQEMVSRLTHTPIPVHNSSTNGTITDNPITFPLDHSLYVDATHEVVVLNIITALNLTTFAASGPLPYTHIQRDRKFKVRELAPFATNVQFQLLACESVPGEQIRVIINDGVAPLTGIRGCPDNKDGMCAVSTFVEAQKETIAKTDWNWDCEGDWDVPAGDEWETVTGDPPQRQ